MTDFINVLHEDGGNENKGTEKGEIEDDVPHISLKDKLKLAIQNCTVPSEFCTSENNSEKEIYSVINKELTLIDGGGS